MANRAHLMIKVEREQADGTYYKILLTGINSIPHFWLLTLNRNDLEQMRLPFRRAMLRMELWGDDDPTDTMIIKDKSAAIELAEKRKDYIATVYPQLLEMYEGWILYLKFLEPMDDEYHIDFWEMSTFEPSTDDFIDGLLSFYDAIDRKQQDFLENVGSTLGWENWEAPQLMSAFSELYEQMMERELPTLSEIENQPIPIPIRGVNYPKRWLYKGATFMSYVTATLLLLMYYFRFEVEVLRRYLVEPLNGWLVIALWIVIAFFLLLLPFLLDVWQERCVRSVNKRNSR